MHRNLFIAIAGALAMIAVGLLAYQWAEQPTALRIAVGPIGSEDARLVTAIAQHLAREHDSLRLKPVVTEGPAASAKILDDSHADLAIVRTDIAMPIKGQTAAIMHRDAAVLVTVPDRNITNVSDLKGRAVGVLRRFEADDSVLDRILAQYDVAPDSVAASPLAPSEVEQALRSRRVDAVLVVAPLGDPIMLDAVGSATAAGDGAAAFIPIGEANVIAQRLPQFESVEVVRGTFGGNPPRPAEGFTTLGVSTRLVAASKLDDNTVSELTRLLFLIRPAVSREVPLANQIDGPNTSKSVSLPNHPGAAAYYEGEVQTFIERYSDWFYFVVMLLSVVGSGVAGFASNAANRSRARNIALLTDLLGIVRHARDAETEEQLDALEFAADEILAQALAKAGGGGLDNAGVAAFTLGLDQARRAIAERRSAIADHRPALSQAAE